MEREIFTRHFRAAQQQVMTFSRTLVMQNLPDELRFLIYPNQSYDRNPLVGDEVVFPEDALPEGQAIGPIGEQQVIQWLWRNGKIPEWINISVEAQDSQFTYLSLMCCGRFTADEKFLYHHREGFPPFHVLSPNLPIDWENVETHGKFDLYWQKKLRQPNS